MNDLMAGVDRFDDTRLPVVTSAPPDPGAAAADSTGAGRPPPDAGGADPGAPGVSTAAGDVPGPGAHPRQGVPAEAGVGRMRRRMRWLAVAGLLASSSPALRGERPGEVAGPRLHPRGLHGRVFRQLLRGDRECGGYDAPGRSPSPASWVRGERCPFTAARRRAPEPRLELRRWRAPGRGLRVPQSRLCAQGDRREHRPELAGEHRHRGAI